jgi:hypothetical protein
VNALVEANATALMVMTKKAFTFLSINTNPIEMAYKHSYVSNALKVWEIINMHRLDHMLN